MRRKLPEDSAFPVPYISKHAPSHGAPSVTKAHDEFMEFINTVFNDDGTLKPYLYVINNNDDGTYKDIEFPKVPGQNKKNCKWCEFLGKHCDGKATK